MQQIFFLFLSLFTSLILPVVLPVSTLSADETTPPIDHHPDHFFSDLMNMAVTLVFIIAVLLIVSWFVKRMMSSRMQQLNTRSGIKIIEQRALTQKSSI